MKHEHFSVNAPIVKKGLLIRQGCLLVTFCSTMGCYSARTVIWHWALVRWFTILKVDLTKPDHLLPILNQINNNIQFTMEKSQIKTSFSRYNDRQSWYKRLKRCLKHTKRLKTICLTYVKPCMVFFNKYTILSCKRNIYHCWGKKS